MLNVTTDTPLMSHQEYMGFMKTINDYRKSLRDDPYAEYDAKV
jgi:hypothetical protein